MGGSDLFQAMGGTAACRRLSEAFYGRVARDPVLRPLFPGKTLHCAIEEFSAFLIQFLGGAAEDTQRRWWLSLRESHLRFKIGRRERDTWMKLMLQTLEEASIEEPAQGALRGLFERASAYVINVGGAPPAPDEKLHPEMERRWSFQLVLDEAVVAVHRGDAAGAIRLAERCRGNRSVFAGLLASMINRGNTAMLGYAQREIEADPALARERYAGRTLLHVAAGAGRLPMVELLLRLGVEPDVADGGSHTPLYSVANQCKAAGGAAVVRALVRAGANVDARDGVKHCTALHMAARRGNVEIAEALLDCGATIEMKDSLGETPLRRAVNLDKTAVAGLLLARGADAHSKGSKGLTPALAARSSAMKRLLESRRG
jgi:hemoglobin